MQTVLLVDDDEIVRRMLHNYLERCGFNLLEAPDGDEALLIAEFFEGTIEFLVTDLVMPRIGGLELAGALRQLRPAMRCIFISGYPREATKAKELDYKPIVLCKPFYLKDLVKAMESSCDAEDIATVHFPSFPPGSISMET